LHFEGSDLKVQRVPLNPQLIDSVAFLAQFDKLACKFDCKVLDLEFEAPR